MADDPEDPRGADWELGYRAAWVAVLSEAVRHLGYDDPESGKVAWIKEREAAVAKLRRLCADHGDNDWTDRQHLADVIEKHLGRHLNAPE